MERDNTSPAVAAQEVGPVRLCGAQFRKESLCNGFEGGVFLTSVETGSMLVGASGSALDTVVLIGINLMNASLAHVRRILR